ncbi:MULTISPECIES: hypothetical protein [unclassified Maridesulfovibrio]|uniref:hypothetical protein n=1 Tax=unclassified Maridesulfovibrio TaxID=2794999 RepID=UPI0029CA055C|nr:hypothetical protein [Maridesulfovibrio sp.]
MAAIIGVVGAAVSAVGQISAQQSKNSGLEYNAQLQEQNAILTQDAALRNIDAEEREHKKELELLDEKQKRERSQYIAENAASGFEMVGTPLSILASTDWMDERDKNSLIISHNQRKKNIIYEADNKMAGYYNSAAASRMQKSNAGFLGAGGSLLSMGSQMYG